MVRTAIDSQVITFLARAAQNLAHARRLLSAEPELTPSPDIGDLIRAVHDATVPGLDGSTPVEVERIITRPPVYRALGATLEQAGVYLMEARPGTWRHPDLEGKRCIFLDVATLVEKLLPPVWRSVDVELLLLNGLAGASRRQRPCGGQRLRGVEVPLAEWHAGAIPKVPAEMG